MELSMEIERALDSLGAPDLESRVRAVEELAACSSAIAERVASAFATDEEARFLIFERLGRFGSLMVAPMERVHQEAGDEGLKLMAASALTYLGSNVGVPSLMGVLKVGNPHLCLAATALSSADVSEAADPIERALLECELSDSETLVCLVSSLRRLRDSLPESVRLRLAEVEPAWLRDSLLD